MEVLYEKRKRPDYPICFVRMDKQEALKTIESLSRQLWSKDCNTRRHESFDANGILFTISVVDEKGSSLHAVLKAKIEEIRDKIVERPDNLSQESFFGLLKELRFWEDLEGLAR